MLDEPQCNKRKCAHFIGVEGEEETREFVVCDAFPLGIPDDIAYGDSLHLSPIDGQNNDIVFEKLQ